MSLKEYLRENPTRKPEDAVKAYSRDLSYDLDGDDLGTLKAMGLEESWRDWMDAYYDELDARGFNVTGFDNTGMLEIEMVDGMAKFESDDEAVEAAMADGIRIIPVEELPECFERRYLGWLDTPANRERIAKWAEDYDRHGLANYLREHPDMEPADAVRTFSAAVAYHVYGPSYARIRALGLEDAWNTWRDEFYAAARAKGYAVNDWNGMMEIRRADGADGTFSDEKAVEAAAADGVRLIPVDELPGRFGRRHPGWVDTPGNRARIRRYAELCR